MVLDIQKQAESGDIRSFLENLYTKIKPAEQQRWNESNIDTMFYAGSQSFVNNYFNFSPGTHSNNYYFNLIQQPVNMITGYQRQHRKTITYMPAQGGDSKTQDQYTKVIMNQCTVNNIYEQFSKGCELSCVSGMVLLQPFLDFTADDPAQGALKLKIWEYNSFLVDPDFRNPDMSDCQYVWCQEFITIREALHRFADQADKVATMKGGANRIGSFYFLPENSNMNDTDLLVLSYVWTRGTRKKKSLYSPTQNQFYDVAVDADLDMILEYVNDLEILEIEVPTWKLTVVLNDQRMFHGDNPLGFDECPFVMVPWNYDPHIQQRNLRVRSLVRTMRDSQFLFNYKVISNNDIAAATINSGYKRISGAVANEDNLKKTQGGYDIIINEGYEMTDVEKIVPTAIPESDIALAEQMKDLIFSTSGIQLENWSGQQDSQISALTMLLKQSSNLMVFQKYFDQWDESFKLCGNLFLKIVINNWSPQKIRMMIQEEPTPLFYSKIFAKYQVIVEEGSLTTSQKTMEAQGMLDINATFGREVIPASMIIPKMNIQGKNEIIEYLEKQEMQSSQMSQQSQVYEQAMQDAQLQEMMSKAVNNLAMARERHSRSDSNVGLFEERLSELQKNEAISLREKMNALQTLVETIQKYGEVETYLQQNNLEAFEREEEIDLMADKAMAKQSSAGDKFLAEIMGKMGAKPQQQQLTQENIAQ